MKTYQGLNVLEGGRSCFEVSKGKSCSYIGCNDCLFFDLNQPIYEQWLKYGDLTKLETPFGLLPGGDTGGVEKVVQ